ncbi:hypothetical protein M431DRAFT_226973 [Trichoderma harzianum CBS 226.95]|uniref:Uncharacterized protein n=1 Tax=Trichoderma harzianum CBS 226.95 TaxID=983964 RepID=A0A2T4A412_TRIHA|nr:hypothetical protein M431DRAFT_226973 [Trichoderma harzianum CBS 226.95]PTB51788.1 hypothetical protein M431DRAFT_226973 [Trichoderma harzianum CBS 226.95]
MILQHLFYLRDLGAWPTLPFMHNMCHQSFIKCYFAISHSSTIGLWSIWSMHKEWDNGRWKGVWPPPLRHGILYGFATELY